MQLMLVGPVSIDAFQFLASIVHEGCGDASEGEEVFGLALVAGNRHGSFLIALRPTE